MDINHLRWAQSHDWGEKAKLKNGVISLWDLDGHYCLFENFSELRKWAGY